MKRQCKYIGDKYRREREIEREREREKRRERKNKMLRTTCQ
jgi:hypothetical protein